MTLNKLKIVLPLVPVLALIVTGTSLRAYPPAEPEGRTDRHGDPLPPGVLARMGTVRLRHGGLNALTFSADGKSVTSVGTDRVVRVWDVASGRQVRTVAGPPGLSVFSHVAISPDRKLLALPGSRSLRVWDVALGKERGSAPWKGNAPFVLALAPDGRTLVAAGDGDSLQLWDVDPLRERRLLKHDRSTHHAAFSTDGKVIGATSTFRGALRLWEVESGKELLRIDTKDDALAFAPDGKTLVVGQSSIDG